MNKSDNSDKAVAANRSSRAGAAVNTPHAAATQRCEPQVLPAAMPHQTGKPLELGPAIAAIAAAPPQGRGAFAMRDTWNVFASARHLTTVVVASLALSACSKGPPEPPTPMTKPVQDTIAPTTAGSADPSIPAAASVAMPAVETKLDPAAGRTNSSMSPAQESSAMPLPGQNNDHSAALTPEKRASGP